MKTPMREVCWIQEWGRSELDPVYGEWGTHESVPSSRHTPYQKRLAILVTRMLIGEYYEVDARR